MLASHAWLRAFVPGLPDAPAVGELVGRHVATLDALRPLRGDLVPFVVAQVVASERIPDTKLSFNQVDDGSGTLLEVVCGAPNVTVGAKYPFARTGTTMPGGALTIEKRKIRGFTSNGMLCSSRELGLGQEHDGILTLDTDAAPGTPLLQVLPVGDVQLEFDVLANRPDLLAHEGLARELSALTGLPLVEPADLGPRPAGLDAEAAGVGIALQAPAACPRYVGVVVRGVRVGPSPDWLRARLEAVGARSINNVVDATNYVLHAFGQPTHAFDLARLAGGGVVVREARAGETLVTLDGATRALAAGMLVIADVERPQAVAGVMGGRDSEVTEATTDLLLEVAAFEPRQVRRTRRALGLSTDASHRFERGVDAGATRLVAERLARLVVQVAGGTVAGVREAGAPPPPAPAVTLTHARLERLLGAPVPAAEVPRLLGGIGFAVTEAGAEAGIWRVVPPTWRHDVARDVDLVEEIARLRGFDALPDTLGAARPGTVPDHPLHLATERVRAALVAAGLHEVKPLPFVRGDDATHVRVRNPLAEDEPHLRRSVLESLARRAEHNLARMQGDVRLFEVGSVFAPSGASLPHETVAAGLLVMGRRRPPHFTEPRPPAFDAWDARGLAELLADAAFPDGSVAVVPGDGDATWTIVRDGAPVGTVGPVALDAPVWASAAFGVELTLGALSSAPVAPPGRAAHVAVGAATAPRAVQYVPLPTQPAAEVDLALLVPDAVRAGDIARVVRATAGELLEGLEVFDEFRGAGVPAGHRSLAWRLTFRHADRTLRDKEIEGRRAAILRALEGQLQVRPRA